MNRFWAAFLILFASCTETIELSSGRLGDLDSIEIMPGDMTITLTDLAPPNYSQQYMATGHYHNGRSVDLTDVVTWSIDDALLGAFDPSTAGVFVASQAAVGHAHVSATLGEVSSVVGLTIAVDATVVDATFPPPGAGLFDPSRTLIGGDVTHSPTLLYPSDGTRFPRQIARTLFQATLGDGNQAMRIRFDSDLLHLDVETGADRWAAEGDIQQLLATAGLIAPLSVRLEATTAAPGPIYTRAPATLTFSRDTPGGALFFWSAATSGIMRGGLDATVAAKLYPPSGACMGCHAMSRDGTQMALAVEDGTSFDLQGLDVGTLATTIQPTATRRMAWATYSPDGSRLVAANDGILTEYDAKTGAAVRTIALGTNKFGTHPDWSPDGTKLAIALSPQVPTPTDVKSSSIAVLPRTPTGWGAPQILVAGTNSNNNYFPRWSPDGQLLAFIHATTTAQGAASAELWVLPSSGGTPLGLTTANTRVGDASLVDQANTMPVWGPKVGEHAWLAFVSSRAYGTVLAGGRAQIWITSLDLASTSDSSTPAFWLPSQDVTVVNNAPTWASELVTQ